MKGKTGIWILIVAAIAGAVVWWLLQGGEPRADGAAEVSAAVADGGQEASASAPARRGADRVIPPGEAADEAEAAEETEEKDESEAESEPPDEEEQKVNAFDDLTDKWMEPSAKGVTMADVDNFAKQFREVPKERQDECIHRALNLIPDENVMLLAGVLMDKEMDKEIVETVFNDILNRDEDVKKPILQQVFKDKKHPCWADTAWILDVTGELPKEK